MLIDVINERYKELGKIIKALSRNKHEDLGNLGVSCSGGYIQYYYRAPGQAKRTYLRKGDLDTARRIAQQDYNEDFLRAAREEYRRVGALKQYLEANNLEDRYSLLPEGRRRLIKPYAVTFEDYAKIWLAEPYVKMKIEDDSKLPRNSRGEVMHSKSECIISDIFYELGIPYKNDYRIRLQDGSYRYMDFVVLNKVTRQVKYMEHFGSTNDPGYVDGMLYKITEYARIGIVVGDNFFFTHEKDDESFNAALARDIIIANCCR